MKVSRDQYAGQTPECDPCLPRHGEGELDGHAPWRSRTGQRTQRVPDRAAAQIELAFHAIHHWVRRCYLLFCSLNITGLRAGWIADARALLI